MSRKTLFGTMFLACTLFVIGHLCPTLGECANLDIKRVKRLEWIDPLGRQPTSFEQFQALRPPSAPLHARTIRRFSATPLEEPTAADSLVAVIVNTDLYTRISGSIDQYALDVAAEGYTVEEILWSGGDYHDLRDSLIHRWVGSGLIGAVLVGDLPVAWCELDVWDPEEFPIDYYFMELDGTWWDAEPDGLLDNLTAGSGDLGPEIWVGRLAPSSLVWGSEAQLLQNYFFKNHNYRTGSLSLPHRALSFVDDDWEHFGDCNLSYAYGDVTVITDVNQTIAANYKQKLLENYEWVHLCAHSSCWAHTFKINYNDPGGGTVYNFEIHALQPHALFYNLFACSNTKFMETNNQGNWYIFVDDYGLLAIGSTKSGSMLEFQDFYGPLGQGNSIGDAFRQWFEVQAAYGFDEDERGWYFGMNILGDPTLTIDVQTQVAQLPDSIEFPDQCGTSEWDAIQVSTNPFSDGSPVMATDFSGTIWAVWETGRNIRSDIYSSSYDGASWSPAEPVVMREYWDFHPSMARDSMGNVWVAWQSLQDVGGSYWNMDVCVNYRTPGGWSTPQVITWGPDYDVEPSMTWQGADTLWVVWKGWRTVDQNVNSNIFAKCYDGSWSPRINLTSDLHDDSDPVAGIDGAGRVWVVWSTNRNGNWDIYSVYNDGAWSGLIPITTDQNDDLAPTLVTDASGNIWVAWHSWRDGNANIYASSNDGGGWSAPIPISFDSGNDIMPNLSAGASNQMLLGWMSNRCGNWDIFASFYDGLSWSLAEQVTSDPNSDYEPASLFDQSENAGFVWGSDRDGDWNIHFASSTFCPHILSTSPAANELNVPTSTSILVEFDIHMDGATINDSTFVVNARSTGKHAGTITYDAPSRTVTFDPVVDFDEGEVVTVVLTTGVKSYDGTPLDTAYLWSFTSVVDDGTGTFAPLSAYAVGDHPSSVFSADLDGDGDLDLAVANFYSHNLSVLLNNGDGTFAPQSVYSVGDYPSSVFSADLDGDADLDLAIANDVSDNVSVLLNNGDGTFAPHSVYPVGTYPWSVFSADLDGDGDLDLAVANYGSVNVSVLLNNGDGSFAPHSVYPVSDSPWSVFCADLDGDGDLDLATANWGSDNVSVLLNNGDGTFATQSVYAVGTHPASVFCADLNGDGDLDLATANTYSSNVSVLLNNGDGSFAAQSLYTVGQDPVSVFCADLDGDGDLDLTTANQSFGTVSVLLNNGDGAFAPHSFYYVGSIPTSVFSADVDGDGDLDLATANAGSDNVSVLLNKSLPHVVSASPAQNELNVSLSTNISVTFDIDMDETTINDSTFVVNARSTGLHEGTITYDGPSKTATFDPVEDLDEGEVVTVALTTSIKSLGGVPLGSAYLWSFTSAVYDGSGAFAPQSVYPAGDGPHWVFSADLDGDGDLDLAAANDLSDNVSVLLNNGDGTFATQSVYPVGDSPWSVFCADLDGDGDLDLATANWSSDNVSVLLNNGDGTFATQSFYAVRTHPASVFCADLDGDGDLDLATANGGTDNVSVLLNNGDGTFATDSVYAADDAPGLVFSADLDGDGDLDLAVANRNSDNVSVLLNNGDGTFAPDSVYAVGDVPRSVFSADLDGDGDLDLATANYGSDSVSVLLNNGDGTFAAQSVYAVGDDPISVFSADLDGDGDLDLAAANINSDDVSVLLNNGDGTFAPHSVYTAGDGPASVFSADLDGDGDLDLAVANYGADNVSVLLNCLRGDCNGDGLIDLGDVLYLISYLYKGGTAPDPLEVGDCDCDGIIELGDLLFLISYLYKGGPAPVC